ncbi:MAG: glucose 1-dehydrogenase [Ardenticatenaceae bacterium]|nr:glucose 1-dehydrogenase [Ardenticatenaceae bacterium]HBY92497.1 2-deoxy-D-gluconate 3-dehydrogenase [Chloroflexota bacterium]
MFDLSGKSAVVTGGSRGIGRAIAAALAQAGATVAVTSRRLEEAQRVAAELQQEGHAALGVALDVTSSDQVRAAFETVRQQIGGPDILVNNAGTNRRGTLFELADDDWHFVLDTNLVGAFRCAQEAARSMVPTGWGRIINIASQAGVVGAPRLAAYGASKAGLIQMTRVLALELAEQNITVNVVAPAYVVTDLTRKALEDATLRATVLASIPRGTFIQPSDVAAAVVYLASLEAGMVTGHTLLVDGGWTAR